MNSAVFVKLVCSSFYEPTFVVFLFYLMEKMADGCEIQTRYGTHENSSSIYREPVTLL